MNRNNLFSTNISKGVNSTKDNVIFGASIIEQGDLNDDRPWTVDDVTLQQVVSMGNRPNKGLKARFSHPNMSNDGLGTHLGFWKNFRVENGRVRADLSISESAFDTPKGDLGTYVLNMAEEDPEAFGVSIATRLDYAARDEFDKKKRREEVEEDAKWPMRFANLRAADFVDEPAATRGGLFNMSMSLDQRFETVDVATAFTWLLDNHFDTEEPEDIRERVLGGLSTYFLNKGLSMPDTTQTPDTPEKSGPDFLEAFGDQGGVWFAKGKTFDECTDLHAEKLAEENAALKTANTALKTANTDLEHRLKEVKLGETTGLDETPEETDDADTPRVTTRENFTDRHIRMPGKAHTN